MKNGREINKDEITDRTHDIKNMEGERCGELLRMRERPAGRSICRLAGTHECGEQQRDD